MRSSTFLSFTWTTTSILHRSYFMTDIMRQRGAKHILAVDVGADDNTKFSEYGDTLSGFHILLSKFNPWSKPINVPNQAEVQLRLAYVSCVDKLEVVKNSGYCEYIRPPIEKYGTLQFQVINSWQLFLGYQTMFWKLNYAPTLLNECDYQLQNIFTGF